MVATRKANPAAWSCAATDWVASSSRGRSSTRVTIGPRPTAAAMSRIPAKIASGSTVPPSCSASTGIRCASAPKGTVRSASLATMRTTNRFPSSWMRRTTALASALFPTPLGPVRIMPSHPGSSNHDASERTESSRPTNGQLPGSNSTGRILPDSLSAQRMLVVMGELGSNRRVAGQPPVPLLAGELPRWW